MTDLDLTKLRKVAEAARDAFERQDFVGMIETGNTYRRALDSTTALELLDEIERLQRWKAEAKQVFRGLDELAKVADAPLGHSIIEAAVYCINELRKEIDSLQSTKEEV